MDKRIASAERTLAAKKAEVESRHNKDFEVKCKQFDQEHAADEQVLEQSLREKKHDKLSAYEDKLKEAKKSNDFAKVLEEYQGAQARVDKEMEKQRAKEMAELQRRLKARRTKAKSEKDQLVQEDAKAAEDEQAAELQQLKQTRAQIQSMLSQGTSTEEDTALSPAAAGAANKRFDFVASAADPEQLAQL